VERLPGQRLLAFADEDFQREARARRKPRRVDGLGAIEVGAFDAQGLLAEPRAGGFIQAIVEAGISNGRGAHRRELELPVEILLDQRVESGVGRQGGPRRAGRQAQRG
jgi:hypothetical protein